MPSKLKRKGSPGLEEDAESSKRRFAEADEAAPPLEDDAPIEAEDEQQDGYNEAATATDSDQQQVETDPTPLEPLPTDRVARFAALRARNAASKKSNLNETRAEAKRSASNPAQLTSIQRKKDIAAHKLLKADTEATGDDFERKRAWDWTVDESERWDERMAEKKARKDGVAFQDYTAEAGKVYERQIGQMTGKGGEGWEERKQQYEREKEDAIEWAVRGGGLEIVETETGELIAVDKDGTYMSTDPTQNSSSFGNKPEKAAVDRLVADIKKAEDVRLKKRRERGRENDEDKGDVTYINEKNKQFNMKLARFYDKYTSDIRENFERGTAI